MDIFSSDPNRPGFIAVGQFAVGVIAIGQVSLGVISIGQVARGIFCVGQGAVGVVCAGQGALGLWHASGLLGIAGQRGYGIILHTLPRLVREAPPELAAPTPIEDLRERRVEGGWLAARLLRDEAGAPKLGFDTPVQIDVGAIHELLDEGLDRGCDRAHVRVRTDLSVDAGGYREAEAHTVLVAEDAVVYNSKPKAHLAYGTFPRSSTGEPATLRGGIARSAVFLVLLVTVLVVSLVPLIGALLGFHLDYVLNR